MPAFLIRTVLLLTAMATSAAVAAMSFVSLLWERRYMSRRSGPVEAPVSPRVRSASPVRFNDDPQNGLVSVIIPTHNRARIIGRAIESALAQSYRRLEVVVADDGSADDTRSVVEAYGPRVRYVRQANAGVSAARNFGLRHARGSLIAFLDSDDAWQPWKVEAQVAALGRHPDAGIVWTDMTAVDEADRVLDSRYLRKMYSAYEDIDISTALEPVGVLRDLNPGAPNDLASAPVYKGDLSSSIMLGNLIHTSTVLFRRAWCQRTGGFDQTYERAGEDYEFYIRLSSAGPAVFIDAPSTLYRIGVADQLTAPAMMLEIARNNLRAIETWLPSTPCGEELPASLVRRRFSRSFAWLGEAELEAGHRFVAARRLSRSLAIMPALDKRTLLLVGCALPSGAREALQLIRQTLATDDSPFSSPSSA